MHDKFAEPLLELLAAFNTHNKKGLDGGIPFPHLVPLQKSVYPEIEEREERE